MDYRELVGFSIAIQWNCDAIETTIILACVFFRMSEYELNWIGLNWIVNIRIA